LFARRWNAHALVGLEPIARAVALHVNGEDLAAKTTFLDRPPGFGVALESELVQLRSGKPPLLRDHLRGIALRDDLVEVGQFGTDGAFAWAERIRAHRHPRHALDPRADDDILRPREHALGGEVHGLLAGAAEAVDGRARHLDGKAGDEDRGAPDIHALLAGLAYATDDHVIDLGRIETSTLDDFGKRQRQQIIR